MESIADTLGTLERDYKRVLTLGVKYDLPRIAPHTRLLRLKNVGYQGRRANRLEAWYFDPERRCETHTILLLEPACVPQEPPSRPFRAATELIRDYVAHFRPDVQFADMGKSQDRRKLRK